MAESGKDPEKPKVSDEQRAILVSGCADAIVSGVWAVLTPMAGDLFIRALAERLGITAEEADALVVEEIRRRQHPPNMGSQLIYGGSRPPVGHQPEA